MDNPCIWTTYRQVMSNSHHELDFNEDDQALNILYENAWVRILLLRHKNKAEKPIIEVELSIPNECPDDNYSNPYELLLTTLENLNFIKTLCDNGFSLQLVDRDWLWSASIEISESQVDRQFIESLLPP